MTQETYEDLIAGVQRAMADDYVAVNMQKNPVAVHLSDSSLEALTHQLGQYTIFPRHIVGLLGRAYTKAYDVHWPLVAQELARNIGQEVGSDTAGLPHYELLARGLEEKTKLDILRICPSDSTQAFIKGMVAIFDRPDPAYVAGVTYATECSAVPELRIVVRGVCTLFRRLNGSGELGDKLRIFFQKHLGTWEPSHENGLRETIKEYLSPTDHASFASGFRDVMKTMDSWWTDLYEESRR